MKFLKKIFLTILILFAVTFATKNLELVTIHYYYLEPPIQIQLYLMVAIFFLFGFLIGGFEGFIEKMKSGRTIKRLGKEIESKEKELTSLRNLPLTESKMPVKNSESEEAFLNED